MFLSLSLSLWGRCTDRLAPILGVISPQPAPKNAVWHAETDCTFLKLQLAYIHGRVLGKVGVLGKNVSYCFSLLITIFPLDVSFACIYVKHVENALFFYLVCYINELALPYMQCQIKRYSVRFLWTGHCHFCTVLSSIRA